MNINAVLAAAMLVALVPPMQANPIPRQAVLTGGAGVNGRCTIEIDVDGSAEVEVSSDHGLLTTLSGQTATWRRFQCSDPLPTNPTDFRLAATSGRGTVKLQQNPRNTGGSAVIHINDPKGGRGGYTFDLWWRRTGGGWTPGPRPQPPGHGPGGIGLPMSKTIRLCQDSVVNRLSRDGYTNVVFEHTIPDNNPGRNDWVTGAATGTRRFDTRRFSFSCSVDLRSGTLRSVEVSRYKFH